MSDNLHIPAESWRAPRRQSRPMDPQMVRMGVLAAGVLGVVVLGAGGYALLGHRSHGIPVVEADSRPIRVRPDNPGGNVAEGTDEAVMANGGHPVAALAPPSEAPEPQALKAQIAAAREASAPPPAAPPALALPALQPAAPALPPAQKVSLSVPPVAAPSAISDMPETKPITRTAARVPAPSAPSAPVATAAVGGMQVQLGALDSEQAAMTEWQRLTKRIPDLLGAHRPAVMRAEHDGKTVWRLRTGGFTDTAAATAFCSQVRSKGVGCAIASF